MSSNHAFAEIFDREHTDDLAIGVTYEEMANISWENLRAVKCVKLNQWQVKFARPSELNW